MTDRRVPEDYPSVQAAIEAADDEDCILLGPGTWYCLPIDTNGKCLKFVGAGGMATKLVPKDPTYPFDTLTDLLGSLPATFFNINFFLEES